MKLEIGYFSADSKFLFSPYHENTRCGRCGGIGALDLERIQSISLPDRVRPIVGGRRTFLPFWRKRFLCPDCLRNGAHRFRHETDVGDYHRGRFSMTEHVPPDPPTGDWLADLAFGRVVTTRLDPPEWATAEKLARLERTPHFSSWQGQRWLTCCEDFMTYIGEWQPEDFTRHAPDGNGKKFWLELADDDEFVWDEYSKEKHEVENGIMAWGEGSRRYYVFSCQTCRAFKASCDCH